MARRMTILLIIIASLFLALSAFNAVRNYMINKFISQMAPGATPIATETAKAESWVSQLTAIGTLEAVQGVDVSTQASGIIKQILFDSGQMVKKDDLLVMLNDDVEQAELKNLTAELKLSQINYERQRALFAKKVGALSDLDQAKAKFEEADANVARTQALINQKAIRAPFSGRVGIRYINLGEYIAPGTPLVSLQALDPLRVSFTLPEQQSPSLQTNEKVNITTDAFPTKIFSGTLIAVDSKANIDTHNVTVQAQIANTDLQLYPGLFVDVTVELPEAQQQITIPESAIAYTLYGNSVYVVKNEGKDGQGKDIQKAYRRFVKTGEVRQGKVIITEGLKAGETVVIAGQLKLQDATTVVINNSNPLIKVNAVASKSVP